MRKFLVALCLFCVALPGLCRSISYVERDGSWVYLYDENGRRYKTLGGSSVGEIMGWSSSFFVSVSGSWVYLYDADGRRYKTLGRSSVGDIIGVSGDTFTSRNGGWIYTYNREGKRISTRAAR